MTIKKLYLDEFGNVITVEGGNSMLDNLVIRGVGLSASADARQNTDELVKRWNAYDANQQELERNKITSAYSEQRINMLNKANGNLVSENAELKQNDDEIKNSESVRASIAALTDARINGFINENNELKQEITDQKRQLDDKVKLIKLTDKANSAMSLEISDLKARQVVVAAYVEQRISMLNKANKVLKSNLQSVKADLIQSTINDIEMAMAHAELDSDDILKYLNGELIKLREGKS